MVTKNSVQADLSSPFRKVAVFISYTHDTLDHRERCLRLKVQLHQHGIACVIDRDVESPEEGWPRWCEQQIEGADFVLVVCTEVYCRRFDGREEAGKGNGACWEGYVIRQDLYDQQARNNKYIPVLFSASDAAHIPTVLRSATYYLVSSPDGYRKLYRRLTDQSEIILPPQGPLRDLDQRTPPPLFGDEDPLATPLATNGKSGFISNGPVRFSFADLREVITALHETIKSASPTAESRFDRTLIDLKRKNQLNRMGEEYFQIMLDHDEPYSAAIQRFLSHPANLEVTLLYHEVVDELRRKIALLRSRFNGFEEILNALTDAVVDQAPDGLQGKKQTLGIVLSYMYLQCDIGRKDDSSV